MFCLALGNPNTVTDLLFKTGLAIKKLFKSGISHLLYFVFYHKIILLATTFLGKELENTYSCRRESGIV